MFTIAIPASLSLLLAPLSVAQASPTRQVCEEENIKTIGELGLALSLKAVQIVKLATQTGDDARLKNLIDENAEFSLGAGDVGRPLGKAIVGAKALAKEMEPDSYRFTLWSSIPTPIDNPCGKHEVTVEFIDTSVSNSYPIKFTFLDGKLIGASGWTTWFKAGSMKIDAKPANTH